MQDNGHYPAQRRLRCLRQTVVSVFFAAFPPPHEVGRSLRRAERRPLRSVFGLSSSLHASDSRCPVSLACGALMLSHLLLQAGVT
jgi:hypothetical protein